MRTLRWNPLLPLACAALAGLAPAAAAQRTAGYGAPGSAAAVAGLRPSCATTGAGFVVPHSLPRRVWVPGRYEAVEQRVWVPESRRSVWIAPVYEWRRDACGRPIRVLVCAGRFELQCVPAHAEVRLVRVWRAGHWSLARG